MAEPLVVIDIEWICGEAVRSGAIPPPAPGRRLAIARAAESSRIAIACFPETIGGPGGVRLWARENLGSVAEKIQIISMPPYAAFISPRARSEL